MMLPSFFDPGLMYQRQLTPEQILAANPQVARAFPAWAVTHRYTNPYDERNTMGWKAGESIKDFVSKPNWASRILNQGAGPGGLLGAAAGALAGGVGGLAANTAGGNVNTGRLALLLALVGGGLGAYSGSLRTTAPVSLSPGDLRQPWSYPNPQKMVDYLAGRPAPDLPAFSGRSNALVEASGLYKGASFFGGYFQDNQDPRISILNKLDQSGIAYGEHARLAQAIRGLTPSEAETLYGILKGVTGAAIGALIAKYVFGWGGAGQLGSAVFGGYAASHFGGPVDALGFPSMGHRDYYGNPTGF